MQLMDHSPYEFVLNANSKEVKRFANFKHRTFNAIDIEFFIQSLQNIYKNHDGLEKAFGLTPASSSKKEISLDNAICNFREIFFSIPFPERTGKHISNPAKNSSAKRICMFLRWMVRNDNRKVDFGIWKASAAILMCPLDVHSGNVARKLSLLKRSQNDWQAVEELTANLRLLDASDPVKYDFALFGLGVFEKF